MIGKLDNYLRFNEAALSLRSQRQQLLASNIANADTPNYKARDIDFASALQSVLGRSAAAAPVVHNGSNIGSSIGSVQSIQNAPSSTHITSVGYSQSDRLPNGTAVLYRPVQQGSVDGNTVDMDVERSQFTNNAIRYEAGITLINAQIRGLMSAIQGQ